MRTTIIILFALAPAGWAQGNVVDFRNDRGVAFPTPANRYVYFDAVGPGYGTPIPGSADPNRITGTTYVAGLWYVAGVNSALVDGRISPERGQQAGRTFSFRAQTTAAYNQGTWVVAAGANSKFTLDGVTGGLATLQVRVWDTAKYPTFAAAFHAGEFGASAPFSYAIPAPGSSITNDTMDNLRAFAYITDGRSINVDDILVAEGSNGVVQAHFTFVLNQAQPDPVSVDFATQDGTALSGHDYVGTNGTITFAPGEIAKVLAIALTADEPAEDDETFVLNLNNVVNGRVSRPQASCTITEARIAAISLDTSVSFHTVYNHRYMLERSTNTVNWEPVAGAENVFGTGGMVTILDRGAGCQTMRAYRARLLLP